MLYTVHFQARLSMGVSRQEYWSGLLFPSLGDLSDPGIKFRSPPLQADSLPCGPPGKPIQKLYIYIIYLYLHMPFLSIKMGEMFLPLPKVSPSPLCWVPSPFTCSNFK